MATEPRYEHGRSRRHSALALAVFGVVLAELGLAVVAAAAADFAVADLVDTFVVTNMTIGLSCGVAGVLIAGQRPRNPVGWLLLAAALCQSAAAACAPLTVLGVQRGWPQGLLRTLATGFTYSWPWSIALFLPLTLLMFPDGLLPGRFWRAVAWLVAGTSPVFVLSSGPDPADVGTEAGPVDPWLVLANHRELEPLWIAEEIANLAVLVAAVTGLAIRYRRGDEQRRRQLLWLVLALLVVIVVLVPWALFDAGPILQLLAVALVPAAMTIAVLRHQLLDIRLVLSRAVAYAALTAMVVVAYLGLRRGRGCAAAARPRAGQLRAGHAADRGGLQPGAGAPAAGGGPGALRRPGGPGPGAVSDGRAAARRRQRRRRRTRSGVRGTAAALRRRPPRWRGPDRARHADRAPGAGTAGLPGRTGRGSGRRGPSRAARPRPRRPDRAAGPGRAAGRRDARRGAGGNPATLPRADHLRREEERLRLRRDLHDGLGPVLTGIAFQADAAGNLLATDPDAAHALLRSLRAAATEAIEDVRRLVYALRPPALDEFGLVEALRRHAEQLGSGTPSVTVHAPEPLPQLPAAVEVAAYRIAVEAVTNAVRHSGADRVELRIAVNGALELAVDDDGTAAAAWTPGVGLTSMRERAAELGGTVLAGPHAAGGRVAARLPL